MTRREFGKLAVTGVPALAALSAIDGVRTNLLAEADAPADRSANRSFMGPQSFKLHALHDSNMATARQRHNLLLENSTPVANLLAYLQTK